MVKHMLLGCQVRPLLEGERQKNAKDCISIQGNTVVLAPHANVPGLAAADTDNNNFEMERVYQLDTVDVEQRLFGELIRPLVDRYMAGFNATVCGLCSLHGHSNGR